MIYKPKIITSDEDDLLDELSQEHKETIKRALQIRDILLLHTPNDKRFKRKYNDYLLDFIKIISYLDDKEGVDYSEDEIQNRINALYNEIFKNRRL